MKVKELSWIDSNNKDRKSECAALWEIHAAIQVLMKSHGFFWLLMFNGNPLVGMLVSGI